MTKMFRIEFECDPQGSPAPWSDREDSEERMKQSLGDYLVNRCGADPRTMAIGTVEEVDAQRNHEAVLSGKIPAPTPPAPPRKKKVFSRK